MNKAELVASMAEKSGLTKKDAEAALNAFMKSVEESLTASEKVQLVGFGTFDVRERKARKGRNLETQIKLLTFQHRRRLFSKLVKLLKNL